MAHDKGMPMHVPPNPIAILCVCRVGVLRVRVCVRL